MESILEPREIEVETDHTRTCAGCQICWSPEIAESEAMEDGAI